MLKILFKHKKLNYFLVTIFGVCFLFVPSSALAHCPDCALVAWGSGFVVLLGAISLGIKLNRIVPSILLGLILGFCVIVTVYIILAW